MKNPCLVVIDVQEKLFPAIYEKEIFLNEWSTKITNYNVDLDESN